MAPPPCEIDWNALSPRSREIVLHCSIREAAGYSLDEVAVALDRERPELRHLELPEKVNEELGAGRLRDLRREIEERHAAY